MAGDGISTPTTRQRRMRRRAQAAVQVRGVAGPNAVRLAGAAGFEPGNGGIKIRCLTTWLRPNGALVHVPFPSATCGRSSARDDSGGASSDQRPRLPRLIPDAITRAAIGV